LLVSHYGIARSPGRSETFMKVRLQQSDDRLSQDIVAVGFKRPRVHLACSESLDVLR
jgi:hypothetical protein